VEGGNSGHNACWNVWWQAVVQRLREGWKPCLTLAAHEHSTWGAPAAIGSVHEVPPGHHLEQLSRYMSRRSVAGRCHADFARIGLSVRDKLANRLGWDRRIDHHDVGLAVDACHRRDCAYEIEVKLVVERRVDAARRTYQKQRVSVGGRTHDGLGGDMGARAGPVFDDERLAKPL